jgi:hypothetical protein
VALVSRWGRYDVCEQVLSNQDLLEHRTQTFMQVALQEALLRVIDRSFDVRIIGLLLMHGAKLSEVNLALIFASTPRDMATDRYLVFTNIHNYRKVIDQTTHAKSQKHKTTSVKLPETTPWREEHVLELEKYIQGFHRYAERQIVVNAFDLMCWGICCGATEFAKVMWTRSLSPLRAALIGKQMCSRIHERVRDTPEADTSNTLSSLELWFEDAACNLLEQIPDQESARKLLLTSESDFQDLGSHWRRSNLLEVAVELNNRNFLAHRYCQGVVEEMWLGRSPACGRVRLKKQPRVLWVLLQILFPFVRWVKTEINDLYRWRRFTNDLYKGSSFPTRDTSESRNVVEVSLTKYQHMIGIYDIPLVKRFTYFVMHVLFVCLFLGARLGSLLVRRSKIVGRCALTGAVWCHPRCRPFAQSSPSSPSAGR